MLICSSVCCLVRGLCEVFRHEIEYKACGCAWAHNEKYIMRNFSGLYNAMYLRPCYAMYMVPAMSNTQQPNVMRRSAPTPTSQSEHPPVMCVANMRGKIRAELSFRIQLKRLPSRFIFAQKRHSYAGAHRKGPSQLYVDACT